jgi:Ca2+-binding RTX toxin-like protein
MCVLCLSNPAVDWHNLEPLQSGPMLSGPNDGGGTNNGTSISFNAALVSHINTGVGWVNASNAIAQTITYGFTTSAAFASGFEEAAGWSALNAAQKTASREMMTLWDDLIAPSFVESTGSPNAADIKFSNSNTGVGFAAGYYPGEVGREATSFERIEGSLWLNSNYSSGTNNLMAPTINIYAYSAILHEIGHTLGLDHGGDYNGGTPAYGNTATGWIHAEDSRQYTIMSYFNASATGANWLGKYAQTPMVYDILAVQQLYGADYTTRAGNTTYGFNANAANNMFDFTKNTAPILTIWDGGGADTIDLSGWSSASTLNLTAGSYSNVNGMTKNLAIAYGADIENATTGSGNDTITGNDLANVLNGNAGNDTINGAGGDDTINGGAGIDILIGGSGNDTIYFDSLDNLTLLDGGTGFDILVEIGSYIAFDFVSHNFEVLKNLINDTGSADWSQQSDFYDVAGQRYQHDVNYDNGTRSVTEYDVGNTESWSERTSNYDANGNLLSLQTTPDVGGQTNTAPTITSNGGGTSTAVGLVENNTYLGTVEAYDADAGAVLTYSLSGGADVAKFTINATTGALSFVSAPNFEAPADAGANNVYNVQVKVSDGTLFDTQDVAVTITNQNEAPAITSNGGGASTTVGLVENNTYLGTVEAYDADAGAVLTYSLTGGADVAKFTINATTGALSFVSAPNFEAPADSGANNVYNVQVKVSDGTLFDTQDVAVTVTNQNEAPTITSNGGGAFAAFNLLENNAFIGTIAATDVDSGAVLAYSISGGADMALFSINSSTGALSFISAPNVADPVDADNNNIYDVQIKVTDGTLVDTQNIAITVTNQNEAPTITSNGGGASTAIGMIENTPYLGTVSATDPDIGSILTYSLSGGADIAKFTINATTGALSFVSAPDFEMPSDTGSNNIYNVQVKVSDGTLSDTQDVAVTITNQNEAPKITYRGGGTTASVSVFENSALVGSVSAVDIDAASTLSYAIIGGADSSLFKINSSTGSLSFISTPDFDAPNDNGLNNVYDVQVQVSDGSLSDSQSISVSVMYQQTLVGDANANTLTGGKRNDTLTGLGSNDVLYGEGGRDTAVYNIASTDASRLHNSDGTWAVSSAQEGTDILSNIEVLQFSDRKIVIEDPRSDFNADGNSDLLWFQPHYGTTYLWTMNNNSFTKGTALGTTGASWTIQTSGDFNGDGSSDILWKNTSSGQFYIWNITGGTGSGGADLGVFDTKWSVMGSGDFNADGTGDLVWRNSGTGQINLWTMNNDARMSNVNMGVTGVNWTISAVGDFNGDGTSDLAFRNTVSGQVYLWDLKNGTWDHGADLGVVGTNWQIVGSGDFNADGTDDLAWRNSSDGTVCLWLMKNDLVQNATTLGATGTAWIIDAISDLNGDGTSDLVFKETNTGQFWAWNITEGAWSGGVNLGHVGTDWILV